MRVILLSGLCLAAFGQTAVFMEPVKPVQTNRADVGDEIRTFRKVADDSRYRPWLEFPQARRAKRLYAAALGVAQRHGNPRNQPSEYYIALVPKGNHASVGFKLEGSAADHSRHAYILLDPSERSFSGTMLHETGHVAMAMLAGGRQLSSADLSAIPHSTATLSDRATAFSEGYAIHLETLAAHLGETPRRPADAYFQHSADLMTYSQTQARYTEVRDNNYAFQSAYRGPDYLRVQLEKARDFAELRGPNELLQSEGFVASFFFRLLTRGDATPAVIDERQERVLRAMFAMFQAVKAEDDTPWLLHLAAHYDKLFADDKHSASDLLLDLSHGVFLDREAQARWRTHYLAALRLDIAGIGTEVINAWRKQLRGKDASAWFALLGPQLRCEVPQAKVHLVAFGEAGPLVFDINTLPEPLIPLVPGLTAKQASAWTALRPFRSVDEFRDKVGANACTAK